MLKKIIFCLSLFTSLFVRSQECKDLLYFKADEYYINVTVKPDSLSFINCKYIQKKLNSTDVFFDVIESTINDLPVFIVTIIKASDDPEIIEIPRVNATSAAASTNSDVRNEIFSRGIIITEEMLEEGNSYYGYEKFLKYIDPYLIGVKTIYYSTSRLLNLVNLKFFKDKQGDFLFTKYHLIRLHTAASFLGGRQQLFMPRKMDVLLVGNIRYDCDLLTQKNQTNQWSYLPGTKEEIIGIQAILKTKHFVSILDSCFATEKKIISSVNNARLDVIHFATHGFYFKNDNDSYNVNKDTYPLLRAGIVLSGANSEKSGVESFNEEGLFTALEFQNMNLSNIRLAVFSTCHSGEGDNSQNSMPLGINLAIMRQGIRAMMISNREVPDEETSLFMRTFYKFLNQNINVDECFTSTLRTLYRDQPKVDWSFFDLVH